MQTIVSSHSSGQLTSIVQCLAGFRSHLAQKRAETCLIAAAGAARVEQVDVQSRSHSSGCLQSAVFTKDEITSGAKVLKYVWCLMQVHTVLSSPLKRATATAQVISRVQSLAGYQEPKVQILDDLTNRGMGEWEGRHALEVWVTG